MTITEYVLVMLLSANGAYLFSHMRRIQEASSSCVAIGCCSIPSLPPSMG
jgi:hypothetical protein